MKIFAYSFFFLFFLTAFPVFADEGMWTFDNIPAEKINSKYGFYPDAKWTEKLRLACIRLEDGGSASFISPKGLIITNNHVALRQVQKLSDSINDYVTNGFYASAPDKELKCKDMEANLLFEMKNVTSEIIPTNSKDADYAKKIKENIASLEKKNLAQTGLKSSVVSLYHGGEYWLYTYKTYRDIRLVMTPPRSVASFGGDWDNFTYPRYDMDFALLRIYENGSPLESPSWLKVNPKGAKENELIFVAGNPGSTQRGITFSEIGFAKNYVYPYDLEKWSLYIANLKKYMALNKENKRKAGSVMASFSNTYKVKSGEFASLKRPEIYDKLAKNEAEFLKNTDKETKTAYQTINTAMDVYKTKYLETFFAPLSSSLIPKDMRLARIAKEIVQYASEIKKPNGERLAPYTDANLDRFRFEILSPEPIYKDTEEIMLTSAIELSKKYISPESQELKILLEGKTPAERSRELISATHLDDPAYRKTLLDGGENAVKNSSDPLIMLARELLPFEEARIEWYKKNIENQIKPASEKIAKAKFRQFGKEIYPDATFTLRVTYGPVRGYQYNGTTAPATTTFYGMFDRHYSFLNTGFTEWLLPKKFLDSQKDIDLRTPANFVYEADTIGGNSGSPVVNKNLEFVGINFDRNTEGMIRKFIYDPVYARSVGVHAGAITEVLEKIYKDKYLLKEMKVR